MKPGTLVRLKPDYIHYHATTVQGNDSLMIEAKDILLFIIMPNMIGMFIRHEERHLTYLRHGRNTPAIFLFEDKLVSAYLEVFESLKE